MGLLRAPMDFGTLLDKILGGHFLKKIWAAVRIFEAFPTAFFLPPNADS